MRLWCVLSLTEILLENWDVSRLGSQFINHQLSAPPHPVLLQASGCLRLSTWQRKPTVTRKESLWSLVPSTATQHTDSTKTPSWPSPPRESASIDLGFPLSVRLCVSVVWLTPRKSVFCVVVFCTTLLCIHTLTNVWLNLHGNTELNVSGKMLLRVTTTQRIITKLCRDFCLFFAHCVGFPTCWYFTVKAFWELVRRKAFNVKPVREQTTERVC